MSPLRLSLPQTKSLHNPASLLLVMAGQGGGKTFGIGLRTANYVRHFPQMLGMVAANTYMQLTQSTMVEVRRVWKNIFGLTEYDKRGNPDGVYVVNKQPPQHFRKFHDFDDYRGVVSFRNGAVIFTASLDNYLAHEGKTLGWAELDETKDTKEQAVKQVILARLRQSGMYVNPEGEIIYSETPQPGLTPYAPCVINTSPAEGTVDWLETMFNLTGKEEEILDTLVNPQQYYYRQEGSRAVLIYQTYWNAGNLPANYIPNRREQLTDGEFQKFILGYPFSKTGAEYYPSFSRTGHVRPLFRSQNLPDHLGYDFNLWPYMTLLCCQIEETATEMNFLFYKEYCFPSPANTTEAVTTAFVDDNAGRIRDVFIYGDAQGNRGVEGFGDSVRRFDDAKKALGTLYSYTSDRTTMVNPGVNKRRNLIERIFAGKQFIGPRKVNIYVDGDGCPELVKDLTYLKQGANGKLKEKVTDPATGVAYEKLGHTSDALEYIVAEVLSDFL